MRLPADAAGYYSTMPLEKTLCELVDFARLSRCAPRLTVGAANLRTSDMRYFDSRDATLTARHVMASGALPPAFPPIRIDGDLYWDGGILSNTPVEAVFDDAPRRSSLVFAIHIWNPQGLEPENMWQVLNRHKDIQYSSRALSHIMRQKQIHRLRHIIAELAMKLPPEERESATARQMAAYGCLTQWCACSRRGSTMKTTPRTSTSAARAFARAGPPAMTTPSARWRRRRGSARSIRLRASICMSCGG
jgi:NTE family protein